MLLIQRFSFFRIIADSGVESRYPFLDERVVSYLNSLPIWIKVKFLFGCLSNFHIIKLSIIYTFTLIYSKTSFLYYYYWNQSNKTQITGKYSKKYEIRKF